MNIEKAKLKHYNSAGIYFLWYEDLPNRFKIGKATNLKDRINSYTTASPSTSIHSYILPLQTSAITQMEKLFHDAFDGYRIHGEWFDLPDNWINYITNNQLYSYSIEKPLTKKTNHTGLANALRMASILDGTRCTDDSLEYIPKVTFSLIAKLIEKTYADKPDVFTPVEWKTRELNGIVHHLIHESHGKAKASYDKYNMNEKYIHFLIITWLTESGYNKNVDTNDSLWYFSLQKDSMKWFRHKFTFVENHYNDYQLNKEVGQKELIKINDTKNDPYKYLDYIHERFAEVYKSRQEYKEQKYKEMQKNAFTYIA
jgi:hypothetical protein